MLGVQKSSSSYILPPIKVSIITNCNKKFERSYSNTINKLNTVQNEFLLYNILL